MASYTRNITIEKGTDFALDINLKNTDGTFVNLNGVVIFGKLKKHFGSNISYPFYVSYLDAAKGKVRISMASSITSVLPSGRNVYDVLAINADQTVTKVIKGMAFAEETSSLTFNSIDANINFTPTLDEVLRSGNYSNLGFNVGVSTFNNTVTAGGEDIELAVNGDLSVSGTVDVFIDGGFF